MHDGAVEVGDQVVGSKLGGLVGLHDGKHVDGGADGILLGGCEGYSEGAADGIQVGVADGE